MFLRDFLHYEYCPEGAGDQAAHARSRRTHRLVDDRMLCQGAPCAACGCPEEEHRVLQEVGRDPFPYCLTYGCGCEALAEDQQTG